MITAAIEPGKGGSPAKPPALPRHYGGSKVGRTTALIVCAVWAKALRRAPPNGLGELVFLRAGGLQLPHTQEKR